MSKLEIEKQIASNLFADNVIKYILTIIKNKGKFSVSEIDSISVPSTSVLERLYYLVEMGVLKVDFEGNDTYYEDVFRFVKETEDILRLIPTFDESFNS